MKAILVVVLFLVVCCQADRFRITFTSEWNADYFPTDFPANAHFSPLVGSNHNVDGKFWGTGTFASGGVQVVAETGNPTPLLNELASDENGHSFSGTPTELEFIGHPLFPFVSVITMIAPSPDWFTGLNSVRIYSGAEPVVYKKINVFVYDAGTDDGTTFTSANSASNPITKIQRKNDYAFATKRRIGFIEIELLRHEKAVPKVPRYGFYSVAGDDRDCAFPDCGGYFMKLVNHPQTPCDYIFRNRCYVAVLGSILQLGAVDTSGLIARGEFADATIRLNEVSHAIKNFKAEEYLRSVNNYNADRMVILRSNRIVCVTTPCFSWDILPVNEVDTLHDGSEKIVRVSSFALRAGQTKEEQVMARKLINKDGLVVVGYISVLPNRDVKFIVKNFWLPADTITRPLKKTEDALPTFTISE